MTSATECFRKAVLHRGRAVQWLNAGNPHCAAGSAAKARKWATRGLFAAADAAGDPAWPFGPLPIFIKKEDVP